MSNNRADNFLKRMKSKSPEEREAFFDRLKNCFNLATLDECLKAQPYTEETHKRDMNYVGHLLIQQLEKEHTQIKERLNEIDKEIEEVRDKFSLVHFCSHGKRKPPLGSVVKESLTTKKNTKTTTPHRQAFDE